MSNLGHFWENANKLGYKTLCKLKLSLHLEFLEYYIGVTPKMPYNKISIVMDPFNSFGITKEKKNLYYEKVAPVQLSILQGTLAYL